MVWTDITFPLSGIPDKPVRRNRPAGRTVAKRLIGIAVSRQENRDRTMAAEGRIHYHALSLSRVCTPLPVRAWIGGPGTRRGFLSVRVGSTSYVTSDTGTFFLEAASSTMRACIAFSSAA